MTSSNMPGKLILVIAGALVGGLTLLADKSFADELAISSESIEILNSQPQTLTVDAQNKVATTLFVRNLAANPVALVFEAVVKRPKDSDVLKTIVTGKTLSSDRSNTIEIAPYQAGQPAKLVSLEIDVLEASPPIEGYLIVGCRACTGKKVLATIPLKLRLPLSSDVTNRLIFGALSLAGVIALCCGFRLSTKKKKLYAEMGLPTWTFTGSWASNLTVASGVLNTTLGVTVLPEQTYYLNKSTYIALNILFVGIAGLAPVVYNFTRRMVENPNALDGTGVEYRGRVIYFLIASAVTLWAVLGQLGMQTLTVFELHEGGSIPKSVFVTLLLVLALLTILLIIYAVYTICKTAMTQTIEELRSNRAVMRAEAAAAGLSVLFHTPQPRWALL